MVQAKVQDERVRSRHLRIGSDSAGQVSFSIIAVVLLVASALAGTYLAKQQIDELGEARRQQLLDALEKEISDIASELSLCAACEARKIVSGWSEFPVNESAVSDAFSESMRSYISSSFPRKDHKFSSSVANWTGGLFYVERSTSDLLLPDSTKDGTLSVDGEEMEYEELSAPSDDSVGVHTVNPYYVAVGNFTVSVEGEGIFLSAMRSFERPIISALPFLESKLRSFESSSEGEFSDLGRMVEYMLSTLAQLRVLEGYGQPMYSGGLVTDQILTENDVYRAVGVGLLPEQARLFRDVDEAFCDEVAETCGGGELGLAAMLGKNPRALDPAELFLWFLGRTEVHVDPRAVVAQSIPALGKLAGRNWGGWCVEFGLYLEGIPREFAKAILSKDTGDMIDFWVLKARAYGA